jgi:hypothetical protein
MSSSISNQELIKNEAKVSIQTQQLKSCVRELMGTNENRPLTRTASLTSLTITLKEWLYHTEDVLVNFLR